mmetsp:Transcript_49290/g.117274  ORF Transcript_49290/g.117274 Transcript_49290/m.117274 type:complete len:288 (-) Transcript_49290:5132-5995(-)
MQPALLRADLCFLLCRCLRPVVDHHFVRGVRVEKLVEVLVVLRNHRLALHERGRPPAVHVVHRLDGKAFLNIFDDERMRLVLAMVLPLDAVQPELRVGRAAEEVDPRAPAEKRERADDDQHLRPHFNIRHDHVLLQLPSHHHVRLDIRRPGPRTERHRGHRSVERPRDAVHHPRFVVDRPRGPERVLQEDPGAVGHVHLRPGDLQISVVPRGVEGEGDGDGGAERGGCRPEVEVRPDHLLHRRADLAAGGSRRATCGEGEDCRGGPFGRRGGEGGGRESEGGCGVVA